MKNLLKLSMFILISLFFGHTQAQFNYGEALQKSILFYETQQSGKLPDWNRISWRGDAGVTDGQDVGLDLTGGWFDAGDHIKFGFPMAFSVTSLNWGYLEYQDGYDAVNQTEHFKRNIKWVTDYFIKCHVSPNEFYGQISAKNPDHNFWMPAEMVDVHPQYGQRQSYKIDAQNPGTELACETAAALASASIVFRDSDPAYSATLLQHAEQLYEFGDTYRGKYNEEGNIPATGTYSSGGYEDELTWGALWLYKATGNVSYLEKAEAEYTEPDYLWSLVWDDKRYGNMVLLAEITGKQSYKDNVERHLNFWLDNGQGIAYSPGGQAHLTQWGSLRHSMNASLTALIYADKVETNASKKQAYTDFAISQVNYALGNNPNNRSLVTGFGVNPPTKPHHRGQHSSWARSENIPVESRHTMWGALMGGPGRPNDVFIEDRGDFQANEVACDYNSCYQGVLARMVMQFGGNPLSNFPQPEPAGQEFLNEVRLNSTGSRYTEPAIWLNNRSGWPARVPGTLTARYFIDISEGVAAGLSPGDYEIQGRGNGSVVGGLQPWDAANNIYYVEVAVDQDKMPFPGGQGEYRSEVQMRVGIPNNVPESAWDPTNDFSYQGLDSTLKEQENVPIYADGVLVGGNEPGEGSGNRRPIAVLDSDITSGIAPLEVSFDGSGSSDPDGDAITYNWDFGNGQTSTSVDPLITYTETGSYLVSLTVNDGELTSLEVTTTITVTDGSPIASFTVSPDSGVAPLDVTLDASGSTDPTGGTLTYSWDLGNGQTANTVTTSATYAEVGEVTVTLTVTNAVGETDSASRTISVREEGSNDCTFDTPVSNPLPGINDRYDNAYVLGSGGPDLDLREFSINWDLANNGLYTFAVNINQAPWYIDLRSNLTYNFNSANPEATLSGTGAVVGLDGDYWVTLNEGNFVMVSKTGGYTIYFTDAGTAPDCGTIEPPGVDGGTITGGPFTFTVGDGIADNVSGITLTGNVGETSQWVITDDQGIILGLPASPEDVNFDEAPAGTCLIWHLSYNGTISGATVGNNASDLSGDYDLSNSITVTRNEVIGSDVNGGTITGGPFTFTVGDGIADNVSGITLTGNIGTSSQWVVTDDQGVILGLPAAPEDVNFDEAPAGTCLIWHLSYNGTITGASVGNNASDISGDYDLSNSITVTRNPVSTGGDCTFDTPRSDALPNLNDRYDNVYILGTGGPNLDIIREFSINWDLNNNGLYTFAVNINQAPWYVDLRTNLTYNFDTASPEATLSGTGVINLDGSYWVSIDQGNFVMVSKSEGYTLYFTDSSTAPECETTGGNTDPVANISATPTNGEAPLVVNFDGVGSTDADGDALSYAWDFGDGNNATGVSAEHIYETEGTYEASLTVSDGNGGQDQAKINIVVNGDIIINPPGGDNEYIDRFTEMRNEYYDPANGFFSADGSPHHSVETLIVEAPDYGHESTSELYSFWLWLEVMNGRVTGDWQPLSDVWNKVEQFIIPTKEDQPTNAAYNPSRPAGYAGEFPEPSDYPSPLQTNISVGSDPVSSELTATYGADVYQMHWLLDNDNFYGFGNRGDGVSTPSYINTFQRGEQESVYETIPHPSWESFDWGGPDGFLPLFIDDNNYAKQWRYTSAPDADARAVQAMYWAQQYIKEQGASLSSLDLDKATKMGDYLRLAMFDKYFKKIGAEDINAGGSGYDSAHYLMSWYISWGGSASTSSSWAFRISSSHCHFGYQNPVAAYALSQVPELEPQSANGKRDWGKSLERQLEFYSWLQSKEGAIAGGATNSWNGDYSPYPSGKSTFYGMAFDKDPVYHDPGSGTWFGWQAWSMERVAELYYINNDPTAKKIADKWVNWVKSEVRLIGDNDFEIPATLEWTGEPDTWNPDSPGSNDNLSVTVTDYSQDLGIAATTAKALIYYAAATQKHGTLDEEAKNLAKEILDRMWNTYRDEKGVSSVEKRGDYKRLFQDEVYVPDGFSGTMPNGDIIEPGVTFMDIRSGYENDPEYANVKTAVENGEEYSQRYHRGWAHIEVALANAEYGFFFGNEGANKNPTKNQVSTVSLYPNPALDRVSIATNFDLKDARVQLVNIAGKVIKNFVISNSGNKYTMPINDIASGVYIMEIFNPESGVKTVRKLVRQE